MKKALITMGLLCVSFMSIAAPTPEQYQALAKAETLLRDGVNEKYTFPDKDEYVKETTERIKKNNDAMLARGYNCEQINEWVDKSIANNQRKDDELSGSNQAEERSDLFSVGLSKYQAASCSVQASSID